MALLLLQQHIVAQVYLFLFHIHFYNGAFSCVRLSVRDFIFIVMIMIIIIIIVVVVITEAIIMSSKNNSNKI